MLFRSLLPSKPLLRTAKRFHTPAKKDGSHTANSFAATVEGTKTIVKNLKSANDVREFDSSLTNEQKQSMKRFLIYRSNPANVEDEPQLMSYYLDLARCSPMYLDALIKIKDEVDPTLTFRRSCREGVCGSCAMNIDGMHHLACIHAIDRDLTKPAIIAPLSHMFVLKDLVVDMTNFYSQYKQIQPFLQRKSPKKEGEAEFYQSEADRDKLDGLYECIMCASCSTACPSYWWHPEKYLGPAVLMQAYRWIVDSRDEYTEERLQFVGEGLRAEACENIGMCSVTCPKHLDPRSAMQNLLDMIGEFNKKRYQTNSV